MLIDKEKLPLVELSFMDATHLEDVDLINELYEQIELFEQENKEENFQTLKASYQKWLEHTERHFQAEEEKMLATSFFAYACHKGEHERNLAELRELWENFEADKKLASLKSYMERTLPAWLINHILTMDTVTANYFKSQGIL